MTSSTSSVNALGSEDEVARPFGVGAQVVVERSLDVREEGAVLPVAFHRFDVAAIEDLQRAFVDDGLRQVDVTADDRLHLCVTREALTKERVQIFPPRRSSRGVKRDRIGPRDRYDRP